MDWIACKMMCVPKGDGSRHEVGTAWAVGPRNGQQRLTAYPLRRSAEWTRISAWAHGWKALWLVKCGDA